MFKVIWYCRWCGCEYEPAKQTDRDGFCKKACKQAHHRAYKKYVTLKKRILPIGEKDNESR